MGNNKKILLGVNIDHIATLRPEINELNIGHAIVSRALVTGFEAAALEMRHIMMEARQ